MVYYGLCLRKAKYFDMVRVFLYSDFSKITLLIETQQCRNVFLRCVGFLSVSVELKREVCMNIFQNKCFSQRQEEKRLLNSIVQGALYKSISCLNYKFIATNERW